MIRSFVVSEEDYINFSVFCQFVRLCKSRYLSVDRRPRRGYNEVVERGTSKMLAIIAMISDLPAMIAAVVEKLTGADLSGFVQMSNEAIAKLLELADKIF